jgi:transposase
MGSRTPQLEQGPAGDRSQAKGQRGFAVLPWRWIVERTLAWLGRWRRLKTDYECLPETTEALIHIAMIWLMLRRLEPI